MKHTRSFRLHRLEPRLTPTGTPALITRGLPDTASHTAGGASNVHDDRSSGVYPRPDRRVGSDDGRFLAFTSTAANLIPGVIDTNAGMDVFLYDSLTQVTTLVSRAHTSPNRTATNSGGGGIISTAPALSADGRFVVFQSNAIDLIPSYVPNDNPGYDVYLFDRLDNSVTLVSRDHAVPTKGANHWTLGATPSADGRYVVYTSRANNLVPGLQTDAATAYLDGEIYVYDRLTQQTQQVSYPPGLPNTVSEHGSFESVISADGRYVTFNSLSDNLVTGFTDTPDILYQVYQHDRQTGATILISRAAAGATVGANGDVHQFTASADGRYVAYATAATNLISGFVDGNAGQKDVYLFDRQTGQTTLVSRSLTGPLTGGNGYSGAISLSADGESLAFSSSATDLMSGVTTKNQLYLYTRSTATLELVSAQAGQPTQGASLGVGSWPVISRDGRYVAFASRSPDLVAGFVPVPFIHDAYVHDRLTGTTRLASRSATSPVHGGNKPSGAYGVFADGSVLIESDATDLLAGKIDGNKALDVFRFDPAAGTVTAVSASAVPTISSDGESTFFGSASSGQPRRNAVSADGRYIVFSSSATNLVSDLADTNSASDVFLYDRHTGRTTLVSHAAGLPTQVGNARSFDPILSRDGRYVVFISDATNLVAGFTDNNGTGNYSFDVFLYDTNNNTTTLVSRSFTSPTAGGNAVSGASAFTSDPHAYAISGDGRFVTYMSGATDLVSGFIDGNGTIPHFYDLYLFDRITGMNRLVSRKAGTTATGGNHTVRETVISDDGRYIAFTTSSSDLLAGFVPSGRDIFLYDALADTLTLVNHITGSTIVAGNGGADGPVISDDGRYVAFQSAANNLIPGSSDPNNKNDVFVFDRNTGLVELVSRRFDSPTTAGNYYSRVESISSDGRFISFISQATDLVANFVDANGTPAPFLGGEDAYLFDRQTGQTTLVSAKAGTTATSGNHDSSNSVVSPDGRYVAVVSRASDLDPAVNSEPRGLQLYLYDRLAGTRRLVSRSATVTNGLGSGVSYSPVFSADGRVLAFGSQADNLIAHDYNASADLFLYVNAPPRVLSLQINDGTPQRSVVRSLTVTLDQPVTFVGDPAAAFTLTHTKSGTAVNVSASIAFDTRTVVTLTFAGPATEFGSLADGDYTLTIHASKVNGFGPLDGNGDGVGSDNYVSPAGVIFRLFGDATGDRKVNFADFVLFRSAFGTTTSGNPFDRDNDGDVDFLDFLQFRVRFGQEI